MSTKWKKGDPTPNKFGRGGDPNKEKSTTVKKSKLRNLETKLMKLNDLSIENIKKSVEGENVDKDTLATSKWVVSTTVVANRAALAEEMGINKLTDPILQQALLTNTVEGETGFSLTMVK